MPDPAFCRPTAYEAFRRGLAEADTPEGLCRAAVAIAQHADPQASADEVHATLDRLAATVRSRFGSTADEAKLAHLHDVLFDVLGFRGAVTDYYRPENSYLPEVLRSKRGLPITLVLVYKLVAERLGLEAMGVNTPGHFLAAVRCREPAGERLLYVDPFYGGGLLSEEEVFARLAAATGRPVAADPALLRRATPRAWLSRMLLNLQAAFARAGNERELHAMLEMQLLITGSPPERAV